MRSLVFSASIRIINKGLIDYWLNNIVHRMMHNPVLKRCGGYIAFFREIVGKASVKSRESVGKASVKIVDICRQKNTITIPELAALLGITERSVERNIHKLQQNGLLRRIGGRKEGSWEVLADR